jgi:hypothetical protein
MVADFCPFPIFSNLDFFNSIGPPIQIGTTHLVGGSRNLRIRQGLLLVLKFQLNAGHLRHCRLRLHNSQMVGYSELILGLRS